MEGPLSQPQRFPLPQGESSHPRVQAKTDLDLCVLFLSALDRSDSFFQYEFAKSHKDI